MLDRLFNNLNILDIASQLSLPVTCGDHQFTTPCPVCNQRATLRQSGMVCSNRTCPLLVASAVDLVKAVVGCTWAEAINWLQTRFPTALTAWSVAELAAQAEARRNLVWWFITAAAEPAGKMTVEQLQIWDTLVGKGIAIEQSRLSLFTATPAQVTDLQAKIQACGLVRDLPRTKTCLVVPYWADYPTLAELDVFVPSTKVTATFKVFESRYAFAGLLQSPPDQRDVHILEDTATRAVRFNSWAETFGLSRRALAVRRDSRQGHRHLPVDACIFHAQENKGLHLASTICRDFGNVRFTADEFDAADIKPLAWEDFLCRQADHHSHQARGLSSPAQVWVSGAPIDNASRFALQSYFTKKGHHKTVEQLRRIFATSLIYETDRVMVYMTPDGYQSVNRRSSLRETVANFTVTLTHNVGFKEDGRLYQAGHVLLEDRRIPLLLSSRDLELPSAVESAAQSAAVRHDARAETMPVIHCRAGFKNVLAALRDSIAFLPPSPGISFLGWNHQRHTFYGPDWQVSMEGYRQEAYSFDPTNEVLSSFTAQTFDMASAKSPLNSSLRDLVAMTLACVARGFLNYPLRGVTIQQDRHSMNMLEVFFRQLGQKQGISRVISSGIVGYPVFGYGYSAVQLRRMELPMFSLSPQGLSMAEDTEEAATAAGRLVRSWMPKIVEWLLSGNGEVYARARHVMHATELAHEGIWLITNVIGIEGWAAAPVPYVYVEKLLRETAYEDLGGVMVYDFHKQQVRLQYKKLDTDVVMLNSELRRLSDKVSADDKEILVDAPSMFALLQHFYGREPSLPLYQAA